MDHKADLRGTMEPQESQEVNKNHLERELAELMHCLSLPEELKIEPKNLKKSATELCQEKCPLCGKDIHYFYLNKTEKMKMCSNLLCTFPFFTKAIEIISEHDYKKSDSGINSGSSITDTVKDDKKEQGLSKEEHDQDEKIQNLLKNSSQLVKKLNRQRRKVKSSSLTNLAFIKKLIKIEESLPVKKLVTREERQLLQASEIAKNNFYINITVPKGDDIVKVDVTM